jgi:hypothetical protein
MIANYLISLTQAESDDALEAEVTRVFSEFGTVFVKIRRDQRNMPFAFCQFTVCFNVNSSNTRTLLKRS